MSTLTIERERGKPAETLDFIAWKDDRRSFYARPHNGKPRVVKLTPALPDGAGWTAELFPECAPVKITACRLLPPPCRESEAEWLMTMRETWERVAWETFGHCLCLGSRDDKPLQERLDAYKKAAQISYVRETDAAKMMPDAAARARRIEELEHTYNAPLGNYNRQQVAGILNLTLDMVRRGCGELPGDLPGRGCIRDRYLVEQWSRLHGVDLKQMDQHRADCRKWVEKRMGRPALIHNLKTRVKESGAAPLDFLPTESNDLRWLAYCASVTRRVEFADKSAAYVTGCDVREALRAEEWRELRDLGMETPHERRVSRARRKAGEKSCKVSGDPQAKRVIGDEVRRFYAAMSGAKSKKRAGEAGAALAMIRFSKGMSYRTALNYAKQTGGVEIGKH